MKILLNDRIVAFTQGQTFLSCEFQTLSHNLQTFVVQRGEQQIEVRADNVTLAKMALGFRSDYEQAWGDHRYFLEGFQPNAEPPTQIFRKTVTLEPIPA